MLIASLALFLFLAIISLLQSNTKVFSQNQIPLVENVPSIGDCDKLTEVGGENRLVASRASVTVMSKLGVISPFCFCVLG